jgi:hypothetical protein
MKREEIQERIKVLKKEILDRQIEVDNLNQKLIDSSESFRDKFVIWASRGKAKQLRYLPDGDIRVYADDCGMIEGRGVVNLMENEDFELYAHPEIDRLESNSKFMAACAHMMRDNVGSFAIDW